MENKLAADSTIHPSKITVKSATSLKQIHQHQQGHPQKSNYGAWYWLL